MKKISFILFIFTMMVQAAFCETDTTDTIDTTVLEGSKLSYVLPINWTVADKFNLYVTIPEGYRSIQSQATWLKKETPLIEFIPKGESVDNWSEIITVNKFIGQQISAEAMVNSLKNSMLAKVENGKVLKENVSKEPTYIFGDLAIAYDINGKHEVFGSRYYSGPYDMVGIQVTIRPKKDETDEEVFKKIENFFDSNTQIIKTNGDGKQV